MVVTFKLLFSTISVFIVKLFNRECNPLYVCGNTLANEIRMNITLSSSFMRMRDGGNVMNEGCNAFMLALFRILVRHRR